MLNFFKTTGLRPLFEEAPVVAIDVGSRGGIEPDLEPMAWVVSAWGFEPDPDEFERLKRENKGPWRDLTHLPEAVGGDTATRTLHIPKSPEGASLLRHNPDIGRDFAYQDLFDLERTAEVSTIGLDEAIASHGIPAPHFIKLDVEGAELEVLEGARGALQHVVGVKSEVAFMPQRLGQPLARDIEGFLVQHGFMLMDFTGPHRWRREATTGAPYVARSRIAFSRGQLAQGDYIFLRDVETIDASGLDGIRQSIRLALVSLCYGYFDHATWILQREPVERYLRQQLSLDALPALDEASRRYGRAVCLRTSYEHLRDLIPLARSLIRTFRR